MANAKFDPKAAFEQIKTQFLTTEIVRTKNKTWYSEELNFDFKDSTEMAEKYRTGTKMLGRYVKVESLSAYSLIQILPIQSEENIEQADLDNITIWDGNIVVPNKVAKGFKLALARMKALGTSGVMLLGDTGVGKSVTFEAFGKMNGLNVITIDASKLKEPTDLLGHIELENGSTVFHPSEFVQAITQENHAIFIDEFSRCPPNVMNSLMLLLSSYGKIDYRGFEIERANNSFVGCAMNVGFQYGGTFDVDAAIIRRFPIKIVVSDLTNEEEVRAIVLQSNIDYKTASIIAGVAEDLRCLFDDGSIEVKFTTAYSIEVAKLVSTGECNIATAIVYVFGNVISDCTELNSIFNEKEHLIGRIDYE